MYKIDFINSRNNKVVITWLSDGIIFQSTAPYTKSDVLSFIIKGDWILQPKQYKRIFK